MISIIYPAPDFRFREENGRKFIFDRIRKTWLLLTEEEWVRQNFVHYLIYGLGYPATLVALEKVLLLNDLKKRFDILVYDRNHLPWMMVECKAPHIPLTGTVLEQLLRYHITIPVSLLVITNGAQTMAWKKTGNQILPLEALPVWPYQ